MFSSVWCLEMIDEQIDYKSKEAKCRNFRTEWRTFRVLGLWLIMVEISNSCHRPTVLAGRESDIFGMPRSRPIQQHGILDHVPFFLFFFLSFRTSNLASSKK